jgi:DNA processing protein
VPRRAIRHGQLRVARRCISDDENFTTALQGPQDVPLEESVLSRPPLTPIALAGWLRLASARGIPAPVWRQLLDRFAGPDALFGATHATLAACVGDTAARAVLTPPEPDLAQQVARVHDWLAQPGHALVTWGDPAYPHRLATLYDPPPLLYVRGRVDLLAARGIAIVGSRAATPQGLIDAGYLARALSDAGLAVISGLARGIDGAAHRGGLAGAGGTLAVVGTGADLVYPPRHRALADEIAAHGALISEWPLGAPARAAHFPQRNRLIAALSDGVLVVEAALRSGSLITARLANELGREVFAIPGSIHAPQSRGCHALLRDGAKLVESVDDILEELGLPAAHPPPPGVQTAAPSGAAGAVLAALGHAPLPPELLAARCGVAPEALPKLLLELELRGQIAQLPGGRLVRVVATPDTAQAGGASDVLNFRE